MNTYLLIWTDGTVICEHDTWQGAAECMAEYDAEDQKQMYVVEEST